jgi:hypothetical protein
MRPNAALRATAMEAVPMAIWGGWNADEIDEKRDGKDRTSAADQTEDQADKGA